ncbi:MAG: hypothetical protein M0R30_02115 [Methanoregula sp.]|jgi:hypothetical protein|uniref:hypothetical protein n=1 Tax=Methanoregula sp. TaxID=2052170 RepID=UPI0025E12588|nr:hypothetical protein [Methanoregula sp.]MCK9630411.1 hypothetical protein [Methanoregula sp.]
MITRISEIVQGWLGWCPNDSVTPVRMRHLPSDTCISTRPMDDVLLVRSDMIVDYRSTGTSPVFFIGFITGIAGIVFLLSLIRTAYTPLISGVLLCGLILLAAIAIFYENRRACLESRADSLVLHQVLPWPVVIPKNTIATAEVRDNVPSVPLWLLTVLLVIVIPVTSTGVLYGEYLQFVSGEIVSSSFYVHLGFDISIVLFFLVIYYHSRIRSYYPKTLVITTTTKKRIVMYTENPDEITGALERFG